MTRLPFEGGGIEVNCNFDSEHFINNHLVRVNNWEIHPVFKLEFCETGVDCKGTENTGWKSLDDLP